MDLRRVTLSCGFGMELVLLTLLWAWFGVAWGQSFLNGLGIGILRRAEEYRLWVRIWLVLNIGLIQLRSLDGEA